MAKDEDTFDLSPDQHRVLDRILAGDNVFFTGPAGSGKSAVIRAFRRVVSSRFDDSKLKGEDELWLVENDCIEDRKVLSGVDTDCTRPRPWTLAITASTGKAARSVSLQCRTIGHER